MALIQALVLALVALILLPGYSFYFDITPKIVVLLAGTALLLIAVPIPAIHVLPSRGRQGAVFRAFSILILLGILSLAFSTALSVNPRMSLFGTNWRRFGSVIQASILLFAWFTAVICAGRPDRVKLVLRGITIATAISALYGIAQYFGWDSILPAAAYHVGEGVTTIVRPPGTLGYASYFATWLVAVVFLAPVLAAMEDSAVWRRFAFAVAPLAAVAMLLTGTRAAVVGLIAGVAVWTLLSRAQRAPRPGAVARRAAIWFALILTAAVAFYYSPAGIQLRARMHWFSDDPWGGSRTLLWRDSLAMATHRLGAGFGPEVFTAEFPRYESEDLAKAYPDFSHESPHNILLDALVSQGLPGFVASLGLGAFPFFSRREPGISAAAAAVIVCQQFTAFTVPTAVLFFTILGLWIALGSPPLSIQRRRWPTAIPGTVIAAGLLFVAVRLGVSDHVLAMVQCDLKHANLASATARYRNYLRWSLPGGTADLWYSRAVLANPSPEAVAQSAEAARRALQSAEDPFNAWYNLAVLYGLQNDALNSERSLRAAIAADPQWFKPHWTLAQILRLEGRLAEARQQAVLAAQLDAGKDPEVTRTLQEIDPPLQK